MLHKLNFTLYLFPFSFVLSNDHTNSYPVGFNILAILVSKWNRFFSSLTKYINKQIQVWYFITKKQFLEFFGHWKLFFCLQTCIFYRSKLVTKYTQHLSSTFTSHINKKCCIKGCLKLYIYLYTKWLNYFQFCRINW